jgi:hypothetical protein
MAQLDNFMRGIPVAVGDQMPGPLPANTPVDNTHAIPYAGGVAKDGSKVYIDKRVPQTVMVDGKPVDAHTAIALHERTEFPLMHKAGMHYADAHMIATGVENHYIRSQGVDPQKYQQALRAGIGSARQSGESAPADLDRKPYADSHETHLLRGHK